MKRRTGKVPGLATSFLVPALLVLAPACNGGDEQKEATQTPRPSPTAARDRGSGGHERAKGRFSLVMMVHTRSKTYGDLPAVRPLDADPREGGPYTYRSIACQGNAPINNISSDLPSYNARVLRSRVPSSVRAHPFSFRLRRSGDDWRMSGDVTLTVCKLGPGPTPKEERVPDGEKPKIRATFRATARRINDEVLPFDGTFELRGGTQRYEDLDGDGEIAGYLFCFAPEGCAAKGRKYLDGQFVMQGKFHDPTAQLRR